VVKNSALKTVAHRNMLGSVVRHNWLGRVSYACSTDVYVIIKRAAAIEMNSLRHLCILILVLWARTLCFWTETPVRTGLGCSVSTLTSRRIECMDWPDPSPDLYLIKHVWDILQKQICAQPDDLTHALT